MDERKIRPHHDGMAVDWLPYNRAVHPMSRERQLQDHEYGVRVLPPDGLQQREDAD